MPGLERYIGLMQEWKNRLYLVGTAGYRNDPWTYGKMHRTVCGLIAELQRLGMKEGERIIICGPPAPEWAAGFYAVLGCGGVAVPVDPDAPPGFISTIIQKTAPIGFICEQEDFLSRIANGPGGPPRHGKRAFSYKLIRDLSGRSTIPAIRIPEADPDNVAQIVFTSGTMTNPKGVVLTHGNILSNLNPIEKGIEEKKNLIRLITPLRLLCTVPYTHMLGQTTGLFLPLLLGSTCYLCRETAPPALMRAIRRNKILAVITVPRVMKLLAGHIEARLRAGGKWKSFERRWVKRVGLPYQLRVFFFMNVHRMLGMHFWAFITGGAPLDDDTHEFWRRTVFSVFQGYGLTETAPMVTMFNPFRHNLRSVGKPFPGQEVKLAEDGEVLVRGENVMQGYLDGTGLEDLSVGFSTDVIRNGWLHTGDIGSFDEDGQLYIRGRKKNMILSSDGLNIYPEDIEAVLNELDGVRESVVTGRKSGPEETVHAVLLLHGKVEPRQIIEEANKKLQPFQRIEGWSVWKDADFPRTATMKIRRSEVARSVDDLSGDAARGEPRMFHGIIAENTDENAVLGRDLGLDSLDMVEIVTRIEGAYGVTLDESLIGPRTSVGELANLVHNPPASRTIPMPRWTRKAPIRMFRNVFLGSAAFLLRMAFPVQILGRENVGRANGPAILAANHCSDMDPLVLLAGLPRAVRRFVAPAMGLNRFWGFFADMGESISRIESETGEKRRRRRVLHRFLYFLAVFLFGAYPFPQGAAYRSSLEYSGELLDAGYWILLFPQGRIEREETLPFKKGIAVLAEKTGAPVIPVALRSIGPPFFKRNKKVLIAFGKPLEYAGEDYESFTRKVEQSMRSMLDNEKND